MSSRLDIKTCLSVFNHVLSRGEKNDDNYIFQGLTAWSDFDGYNCFLSHNNVTLTMMFHGKYHLDYPSRDELNVFEDKIKVFSQKNDI
jgi:hypothetical protein